VWNPRTWMWIWLAVQCIGLAYDFAWHGIVDPGFNATTLDEMVKHLSTVHLPLYFGVAGMLVSSAWALVDHLKRRETGLAIPVAFAGALIQTAGETWHAYSHLQLTTHIGPSAFAVSFIGMVIVIAALVADSRSGRRRAAGIGEGRRAT
jgi:hypothetical protein